MEEEQQLVYTSVGMTAEKVVLESQEEPEREKQWN